MVGPSKILTVSYGTFSCTLEGFDDPFSTMRGIAEYFRDLAADDRYFGAEPPTPDAEMLHRIAQREVQRRVESQIKDDGIVLRQLEEKADTSTAAPAPAPTGAAAPKQTPEPEVQPSEEDDGDDSNMFADIATTSSESVDDASLTAKLSRIRAVVESGGVATTPSAFSGPIDAAFADVDDSDEARPIAPVDLDLGDGREDTGPGYEDEAPTAASHEGDEAEDYEAEEGSAFDEATEGEDGSPDWDLSHAADRDSPADAEGGATGVSEEDDWEETHASARISETPEDDDLAGDRALAPEQADREELTALDGDAHAEASDGAPDAATTEGDASWGAEAEVEAATDESDTAENGENDDEDTATAAHSPDAEADDEEESEPMGLAARIVKLKRAAMEMSARPQHKETPIADAELSVPVADKSDTAEADENEADRALAEKISDISSQYDAVDDLDDEEAGLADEPKPLAEHAEDLGEAEETSVAAAEAEDEREDTLLANVAAATQNAAESADRETDESEAEETAGGSTRPKSVAFKPEASGDDSFDRILEQTNTRMDETEGNRRRSAIAHLKAAVAATKADRLLKRRGGDSEDKEQQSQYRDDLAQVVRPQRPVTEPHTPTARPSAHVATDSSAPLMLVSALRVDQAGEGAAGIAPRRIERGDEDTTATDADQQSFADFAEAMGATELPDLLEAAAAYLAFVEGRPEFSRPQLMRRVANYEQDSFTREAGLRSFGQLLRQGKLQKLKRGQFTVTEQCRFNPQARIAGE